MKKKEFIIKSGHHFSRGDRTQRFYYSIFFFVLSIIFFAVNSLPFWISILTLLTAIAIQFISSFSLLKTTNQIVFNESCLYELDNDDQFDINKLFGIGFLNHKKNSARFGWRVVDKKTIEIFSYVYKNGERIFKKMISVKAGELIEMQINLNKDGGVLDFQVNLPSGEKAKQTYDFSHIGFFSLFIYKLFPYFGGNQTAPHDMKIVIEEIS